MKHDRSKTGPTIVPEKDGPLVVSGLSSFKNSRGEQIAVGEAVRLCRCGASKTKPFCDSSHVDIGFSDELREERVPDQLDAYQGHQVTIRDNRGICSHAGYCTAGLPEVWRTDIEPWIDADGADREAIVATIRQCPSGALSYMEDGRVENEFNDDSEIQLARNAAYRVRGSVRLESVDFAVGASREHFALCRCGGSRNKPFCDGSHWYDGSKDDEALTISKAARGAEAPSETWVDIGDASAFETGRVYALAVQERQIRPRARRRCLACAGWTLSAPGAGPWLKARSVTARCAARGTATTSIPRAARVWAIPTGPRPSRCASRTATSRSRYPGPSAPRGPSATSSPRRWSSGASTPSSGWSAIPIWVWPRPSGSRKSVAGCAMSASDTKAPRHSRLQATPRSAGDQRPVYPSPARVRPTCSPDSGTPRSIVPQCWR